MKKLLLFALLIGTTIHCLCQVPFEEGYYINDFGKKIECLIKNVDWKNNPTEFQYKLTENDLEKNATIEDVKEFGIYYFSRYVRATVNIDLSTNHVNKLTKNRNPIFEERKLFLNVLVEGKVNLYLYEDVDLTRFFFNKDGSDIEQLIFKRYKETEADLKIKHNDYYKQQLWNELECLSAEMDRFEKLEYKKEHLIRLFKDYNKCENTDFVNYEEWKKRDVFNLTIRPRLNLSSLTATQYLSNDKSVPVDFFNLGFGLGIDAEIIFSFHRNKWAISVEPTFQYFKAEKEIDSNHYSVVDIKSVDLPLGIRHYFHLGNNSKAFINAAYLINLSINSSVDTKRTGSNTSVYPYRYNTPQFGWIFGAGYKINKYSVEMRYNTPRRVLDTWEYWTSRYSTTSLVLGYSIF